MHKTLFTLFSSTTVGFEFIGSKTIEFHQLKTLKNRFTSPSMKNMAQFDVVSVYIFNSDVFHSQFFLSHTANVVAHFSLSMLL